MPVYKVLVVDDSVFMRRIISDLVEELPQFQVIGTARNGAEAVELALSLKPDVITMDVEMPVMNGIEAVRKIMETRPTPIVMLSSLTKEGADETIQALEYGAVDFVQKPSGSISLDLFKVKQTLWDKLMAAAVSKPVSPVKLPAVPGERAVTEREKGINRTTSGLSFQPFRPAAFRHLVAIGTSTGGPRALQQVLTRLPADFAAPIAIVQHMPPKFTLSLAKRLDAASNIRVVEGEDGMTLEAGVAYIAPGGWHMTVVRDRDSRYRLQLGKGEPRSGHRPSVDVLFESVAKLNELTRHAVIMTGMGSDGAKGMKLLKECGAATTIAEAEETCIVYGMPRAACQLGAVDTSLPLTSIADKLIQVVMASR